MPTFRIQTPSEQVAVYLREKILSGYYRKVMPGKSALAREMGVDPKTAGLALELLEKEKLLLFQGAGRPRRIVLSRGRQTNGLKIMILCYEARDRQIHYIVELGHQRIVFLVREERCKPSLGRDEKVFLECMRSHGIKVGNYNIPDWEESVEGFHDCLDALFAVTPSMVLIADQPELFIAAQQHLLARGIRIPEDVSLISTNYDYATDRNRNRLLCQS